MEEVPTGWAWISIYEMLLPTFIKDCMRDGGGGEKGGVNMGQMRQQHMPKLLSGSQPNKQSQQGMNLVEILSVNENKRTAQMLSLSNCTRQGFRRR